MLLTKFGSISSQSTFMLNGWTYGKEITIPANSIDATLSYFPLSVYLTDDNFNFGLAKEDGSDIRFTDVNLNQLKFERVEHSRAVEKQTITTTGSSSFVVPAGVTTIDVIAIGGGGGGCRSTSAGGGGSGGDLRRKSITVTPEETLSIIVGTGGDPGASGVSGGYSRISRGETVLLEAAGGGGGTTDVPAAQNGTSTTLGDGVTGGNGGIGGIGSGSVTCGGGGGAGGYSGNGGDGGDAGGANNGGDGSGGAAGGGGSGGDLDCAGGGGGVGLNGEGTSGLGGAGSTADGYQGGGGSGGGGLTTNRAPSNGNNNGGLYGGGGGGDDNGTEAGTGGQGAVVIIFTGVYTGNAKYNIQIPSVSSTSDTKIYMWYGNQNAYNASIESWQDMTGKALTYNGNVSLTYNATLERRVASFDGNGDYFMLPQTPNWDYVTADAITFEINFKLSQLPSAGNKMTLFSKYLDASNYWTTDIYNDGGVIKLSRGRLTGGGGTTTNTTLSIAADTEYSLALCKAAGQTNFNVYLNGSYVGNSATAVGPGTYESNYYIGSMGTSNYLSGYISGMRITKSELYTQNYTPPTSFTVNSSNVIFCSNFNTIYDSNYVMVQHMGNSLVDASGNGNNATNYGSTVVNTAYGMARDFNGSSGVIQLPSTLFNINTDHTLSLLFNRHSVVTPTIGDVLFTFLQQYEYMCGFSDGLSDDILSIRASNGTWANHGRATISLNTDTHTSYVRNSNMSYGVKDGVKGTEYSIGTIITNVLFYNTIGGRRQISNNTISRPFDGVVYKVSLSNIARSDAWLKAESYSLKNTLITIADLQ
jgi:hypothetical protein